MVEMSDKYDWVSDDQIRFSMRQLWCEAMSTQNIPLSSVNIFFVSSSEMGNQNNRYEYEASRCDIRFNFDYFKSLAHLKFGFIYLRFKLYKMARAFAKNTIIGQPFYKDCLNWKRAK